MTTKAQWRHRALAAEAEVASLTTALRDCREPRPKGIAVQGGFQNLSADDQRRELDYLADAGCDWLRVAVNHDSPSPGIAVALRARECGMKVLGVLIGWQGPLGPYEAGAFGAQIAALDCVDAYEFWNEPNLDLFWPDPDPKAYAAAFNAAAYGVHTRRPEATVVSGGLAPSPTAGINIAPGEFLSRALDAGMRPDAIGWHPYCWPAHPGGGEVWSAWRQMTGHPAWPTHEWWATEFGAPSADSVSEAGQATMIREGLLLWASYANVGPLFVFGGRDDTTVPSASREAHFGLLRADWSPKPALDAFRNPK